MLSNGRRTEPVDIAEGARLLTRRITDLRNPLNRPSMCCGDTSLKFQGPAACLEIASNSLSRKLCKGVPAVGKNEF
jgi:hypothetical protein